MDIGKTSWMFSLTLLCVALTPLGVHGQADSSDSAKQRLLATPQLTDGEVARFDASTSLSTIVTDPAQHQKYLTHPPQTLEGRRTYAFELRQQTGMTPGRHFQLINVTWSRADERNVPGGAPNAASTGGPGGSITEAAAQTMDRCFDLRVSMAMLLPNAADAPDIDPEQIAQSLIRAYPSIAAPCFNPTQFPR